MSSKRNEVAARMAAVASQILQAGSRTPDLDDDRGWTLFQEATEAVNRYSGHLFKVAREARMEESSSYIVEELRAWAGDDGVPTDLRNIITEAADALEAKDKS